MPTPRTPHTPQPPTRPLWDVFCQVIDNFGDIGVCWRLACNLAARGQAVRLWVDDASALTWMAPQGSAHVTVLPWPAALEPAHAALVRNQPPQLIVEAFGCYPPDAYLHAIAQPVHTAHAKPPVWINLEYLSAEGYVARTHRLPSPISFGPAAGWTRWFFYPGFTPDTGGPLREPGLPAQQAAFDRSAWRQAHGTAAQDVQIALFCYEPPGLAGWWQSLQASSLSAQLAVMVTPGRATRAVQALPTPLQALAAPRTTYSPATDQAGFDDLLRASDLNMVRGEDSLVRALWAGEPLVWHIYPQDDNAHHDKLLAFLDWLQAPPSLRLYHALWNGVPPEALALETGLATWPLLTANLLQEWRNCVRSARHRLLAMPSLADALLTFAAEKG